NQTLFNAPIGIAVKDDKIFIADTYNDKIRVIENGNVRTIAGSERGFADSTIALQAKFDTPCGIAIDKNGDVLIADTINRRIRKIDANGFVSTVIGSETRETINGFADKTSFVEPVGVHVDRFGTIYVSDEGANAIRVFGRQIVNFSETFTGGNRGLIDANLLESKFNRPANVAFDNEGNLLIADSANKLVRIVEPENSNIGAAIDENAAKNLFISAEDLKKSLEPRWTYNPPQNPREIAGTFGEIRGFVKENERSTRFHNGLDIAGGFGETARFLKSEKVLRPIAAENFGGLRELLRLPNLGYIHISLGRDANQKLFDDARFQFQTDANRKLTGVRVRRGAKFQTGEAIGTLNPMNHVHLIAGESGNEMNAFTALNLPDVKDTVAPKIEKVAVYDENWRELNQAVSGKIRVTARAFDQLNGNLARRKLGVFRLGYQILDSNNQINADNFPTISFERIPTDENEAAKLYATGSQSGATGETVFNYIVTNNLQNGIAREDFFDTTKLQNGDYTIRVFAADFFGNKSAQDLKIKLQNP
ncbi:MAG: hypothetical protein H7Z37_17510, partial [Pyrinomonadaceae bacterium]|nr:hypothetical protein [Pyrinomonadaceae bacterium]